MRIALFPSAYAPQVGGVEELTRNLARELRTAGDEVEVWTIRHPLSLPSDERIDGIRVRRFHLPLPTAHLASATRFPRRALGAVRALRAAAREFQPEIVNVQCFSGNGAYAWLLARQGRFRLVVSLQGETLMDDRDVYERSASLRFALRRGLRKADTVTGCSELVLADARRRFGLPADRGVVVPNGVDLENAGDEEALDLPFGRFVLGLGRVVPKKGFDLLLEAFARLAPQQPDLGLVIGGDGPERTSLQERARELGLAGRVRLVGPLSRREVAWAMRNAAAFALPSRVEPFGIVVLEALQAGCPAVVSSRGGATEIVRDEVDGLVADPLDPGGFAAVLARILEGGELAARLREAGRRRAADFAWPSIAARYRELYEQTL